MLWLTALLLREPYDAHISRGTVYYLPRAVSDADLALMRRIDELHLDHPFMGARMLRSKTGSKRIHRRKAVPPRLLEHLGERERGAEASSRTSLEWPSSILESSPMSNEPKKMVKLDVDEVVLNRFELSVALERLDIIRLVLYRELERLPDTRVMDRGTGSMDDWCQRNRDENAYGGWPARDQNLLAAFEQTWGLSEFLAENSGETVLTLDELKEKDWLLVKESQGG